MKFIGAHVSIAGGVENAPLNAANIGANAFAMFVKNQRQWEAKPLTPENISKFKQNLKAAGIEPRHVLPHNGYLINLGHPSAEQRQESINAFLDEIYSVEALGLVMLNETSPEICLENIANSVNFLLENSQNVKLVIENTAGQGSNLGFKFEHLAYIIKRCIDKNRIGVCLDTCHTFAAGYDIRDDYERVMSEFDEIVGREMLRGMHLNDTKFDLASKKDRHESLGKGFLGLKTFEKIINDPRTDDIPLVLETIDESFWADEIKILRNFKGE